MFSRRLPLSALIELCRVLRHQLDAGITIHQVMKRQGERGPGAVRGLAGRIAGALGQGSSIADALEAEKTAFPPMFLSLVKVGESTGQLAEIFGELEKYYQLELQLRRQFRGQIIMPLIQFVAAVLVMAGLIYILGILAKDGKPMLTFFGLSGASGSLAFLATVFGSCTLGWILFLLMARLARQQAWRDSLLLGLPVLGPCVNALVMSRFTLALQLTLDTGLAITRALRLSLNATGNAHFAGRADQVVLALKNGETLHEALRASKLFSEDFLNILASAEESGQVPEVMRRQARFYHEEASQKMKTLTLFAGLGVWACSAGFIIWAIFRLAGIYLGALGA